MNYKNKISTSNSEANNTADFSYYSSLSNDEANNEFISIISKVPIHTHVDRIYFHCKSECKEPEKLLFKALNDHNYIRDEDKLVRRGMFKRRRVYIHSEKDIKITILYKQKHSCPFNYPHLRIILDNPDIESIDWFDAVCNSFGFNTNLSYVELTMDFYPYSDFIKEYLCSNIILKYFRGTCGFYGSKDGPFYIGNKYKNSKSLIIYRKEIDGVDVLRMELRFRSSFLKRIGVKLDCFKRINDIHLPSIISFKRFNREKFIYHLKWKQKSKHSKLYDDRELINQLREFTNVGNIVMAQIIYMKKSPYKENYQRFFDDITEAISAFFDRLNNAKFI